jgi:hypothetical protein
VFSDDDEAAVVLLATQAGVAIENARLYEEAQQAQQELLRLEVLEERERIAKELHDGVIQALFAVGMNLQGAGALVHDPEIAVGSRTRWTTSTGPSAIFGASSACDRASADRQLPEAIRKLCDEFEGAPASSLWPRCRIVQRGAGLRAGDVILFMRETLSSIDGMRKRRRAVSPCAEPPTVRSNWNRRRRPGLRRRRGPDGMGLANLGPASHPWAARSTPRAWPATEPPSRRGGRPDGRAPPVTRSCR